MSRTQKNFEAIERALNQMHKEVLAMKENQVRLENTVAYLQADLTNAKQLMAHVSGRGMGSTVHEAN